MVIRRRDQVADTDFFPLLSLPSFKKPNQFEVFSVAVTKLVTVIAPDVLLIVAAVMRHISFSGGCLQLGGISWSCVSHRILRVRLN